MKEMIDNLIAKIEAEEGNESKMYVCPAGYLTIGAGINLDKQRIPEPVARQWLLFILQDIETALNKHKFMHGLDGARKIVVYDMAYQMGVSGVLAFERMIACIADHDYTQAAVELLDSKYARQTPSRANRNAEILRTGII